MRIAIASDDGQHVASHTGRCRGFAIFDIDAGNASRTEFRENTFTAHAHGQCGGHGHATGGGYHSHGGLIDAISDCCVLVTRGLGPRLVNDLATKGIEAFVCRADTVDQAVTQFAAGELERVNGTGCSGPHH